MPVRPPFDRLLRTTRALLGARTPASPPPPAPGPKRRGPLQRLPDIAYNDSPAIERFVFICGLHRSGTTLLERRLASRFDVAFLRANRPESEGQHLQSVYRPASAYGGAGRFAFAREMAADLEALLADPEDCRARITADWNRFVVGTSATLLEKSPPNLTKINWLRTVFPGARFVIMTRDPRAASAATRKWSQTPLEELMRHWDLAYAQALADLREEDCAIVRYEDLCADEDGEISRLGAFLDLAERPDWGQVEERHQRLSNSNAKYVAMHGDARYGAGSWERFGYEL